MGTCTPNRPILQQNIRDFAKDGPKLAFDLQIWTQNSQVNFRDETSTKRQFFQVFVQDGSSKKLVLNDSQNKYGSIPASVHKVKDVGCEVTRKGKDFFIDFKGNEVCRSATDWIQLKQGRICLIGRTKYRLCKYIENQNYHEEQIKSIQQLPIISTNMLQQEQRRCRVCYSTSESHLNPLINPCECKGSIGFIHLQCLSGWLFGNIEQNELLHLQTRKSCCEICKTNITETQGYKFIIASVLSGHHAIAAPFAIFQGFLDHQQKKRSYMVLSFANKKQFKIGRSQYADISDKADPFVSRINSIIVYRNKSIWIKDNNSKHGTCVFLTNKLLISQQRQQESLIYGNMNIKIAYKQH